MLGCLGAVLITAGGLGAGSTKQHDPLLESLHLSWMRYGHGLVLSSVLLWVGVTVMLTAWLWLGRRVLAGSASEYTMVATTGFWLAPLLLSVPVFSRDTYSYLAQGALLRDGLDPYAVGPIENPNPLLDNVSPIWTITTAPYGPAFIMIARLVTTLVGNHVIAGTMLLRLCMLPGLALLIWATPRLARHLGADAPIALWICVLNPLVIIHLMGGVHNEMLMVGLMTAGIALTFERHHVAGITLVAVGGRGQSHGRDRAAVFGLGLDAPSARAARIPADAGLRNGRRGVSVLIFVAVFAVLSGVAGVGLGWLTALAGSVKIINWLTIPTAAANLIHTVGGLFFPVNFYARAAGHARSSGSRSSRCRCRCCGGDSGTTTARRSPGSAWAMVIVVLFVPGALPWYYTWPLAVVAPLAQSRSAVAAIAGFSTWIMVIFKPDGAHGMYSWVHVLVATTCALIAWYTLSRDAGAGRGHRPSSS